LRSEAYFVERGRVPWKGLSVSGRIESEYLYATAVSVDPYRIGPSHLAVLPVSLSSDGSIEVLNQDEVTARGHVNMAAWLSNVEAEFRSGLEVAGRTFRGSVIKYLNTQNKLSRQRPQSPRVVWGKGGSHIRAAVVPTEITSVHGLPVSGFVVDLNHYSIVCNSDDEAHYLSAMLNSRVLGRLITEHQTVGEFGPRDIHRRPVEHVPIPLFDSENDLHNELAELSRMAHVAALELDFDSSRNRSKFIDAIGSSALDASVLAERALAEGGA
jgi:hypothetical protein